MTDGKQTHDAQQDPAPAPSDTAKPATGPKAAEVGGPKGLEPTRYGDWERDGRCVDF